MKGNSNSVAAIVFVLLIAVLIIPSSSLSSISPKVAYAGEVEIVPGDANNFTRSSNMTAQSPCLDSSSSGNVSNQTIPSSSVLGPILGHVLPTVENGQALAVSSIPETLQLDMELVFKIRNPQQFQNCLDSINDPSSPNYHHFLNSTTILPFVPTLQQKHALESFLVSRGFNVTDGNSPLVIKMHAPVKIVQDTFGVGIKIYKHAKSIFYASSSDPKLPSNYAALVGHIGGLDNYSRIRPEQVIPNTCDGPYCPQGVQAGYGLSYLYSHGYNGTGQTVAVVDGPGDPNSQAAINTFDAQFGLPFTTLTILYPDGTPSSWDPGWAAEASLDTEAVHSASPGAHIVLVYASDTLGAIDYIATNHLATIESNSWNVGCFDGPCSDTQLDRSLVSSEDSRLALDASEGLTMVFASGDGGATPDGSTLGTEFPASDPNVLSVGATNLQLAGCNTTTCTGYESESGAPISGGGHSGYFTEPSWQVPVLGITTYRGVPDVSTFGYIPLFWVYSTDSTQCSTISPTAGWFQCAGTSLSAPLWAGFLAIVQQMKGSSLGNVDPAIYSVGHGTSYSLNFHDITTGSNNIGAGGYSAVSGWDAVTGLGTPTSTLACTLSGICQGPPIPTNVSAVALSSNSIKILWNASTGATSYAIYRSTSASGPFTIQAGTSTSTTFSDTGLSPNTTYYYVVSASNSLGTSALSTPPASATTQCSPPISGDWTITSSCILASTSTAPANVIVQSGAVLTIPSGKSLNIDLIHYHLLVKSGGGVLIKSGGRI